MRSRGWSGAAVGVFVVAACAKPPPVAQQGGALKAASVHETVPDAAPEAQATGERLDHDSGPEIALRADALVAALGSPDHCASLRKIAAVFVSSEDIESLEASPKVVPAGNRALGVPSGFARCDEKSWPGGQAVSTNHGHRFACVSAPIAFAPGSEEVVLAAAETAWRACLPKPWKLFRRDPHDRSGVAFLKSFVPLNAGKPTAREGCRIWIASSTLQMECSTEAWN
jgi:hypothetical protein